MAKKGDSGCAPLIVLGVALLALGKCAGSSSPDAPSPQGLLSAPQAADVPVLTSLYIQTRSLKCRAGPSRKSAVVTRFARGEAIGITRYEKDWALVPRAPDADCWVARQNLAEAAPGASPLVAAPAAATSRNFIERANDGPSCGAKWKCGQMDSCEEANHYLNQCGLGRLDGDGDGVPCESIC
ncbi:MAG: excalibur calcium-binding domain-containing protein [Pseudomonadota bacterium]|jgi:SH3-like domain-containing protein|nr:excalibur calcium-binding domain-containing protein [Pseudomonadota bacterium]